MFRFWYWWFISLHETNSSQKTKNALEHPSFPVLLLLLLLLLLLWHTLNNRFHAREKNPGFCIFVATNCRFKGKIRARVTSLNFQEVFMESVLITGATKI